MPELYPPTTYLDVPELLGPDVSPTGIRVAFLSNDTGRRELYVAELESGAIRQLTQGQLQGSAHPADYAWAGNGTQLLAFTAPHDDPEARAITAFPVDGSQPKQLVTLDRTLPDRSFLFNERRLTGRYVFHRFSGTRFDRETGEITPLIDRENVANATYSPDERTIAFDAGSEEPERFPKRDNFLCDPDGDNIRTVVPGDNLTDGTEFLGWHPTERRLLVHDHTNDRVGLFAPDEDTTEWITSVSGTETVCGFADKESIVLQRNESAVRMTFDGEVKSLGLSNITAVDVHADTVVGITASTETEPPALVARTDGGTTRVLYQPEYGPIVPARDDTVEERATYETPNGEPADVIVHHTAEEPAPAVAVVYSPADGPSDDFPRWVEYLVHRGYTVVRPHIPSDSKTDAAVEEIAAVGQWLCGRSWVDGDRIAVFGHSSGGRDVYMQLLSRETTPWKAGIARNGVTDLRMRDAVDPEWWLREQIGTPDEHPDEWAHRSPIEYAETGVAAPLRIHHARHDTLVLPEQARMLRDGLCEAGCIEGDDFEYQELAGQGHNTADIYQVAAELSMFVDFLDRRL